ncbi:MAG: FkbM family methyltransferase [Elioraea sp.]|nr:FkbM family methyltransferase [Elioraea sp.]
MPRRLSYALAAASATVLRRLLASLPAGDRSWLARRLVRDRYSPEARALAEFCERALFAWKNRQYDIRQNGEVRLLERLAPFGLREVFDVGANVGEWAEAACRILPSARVHAFEIAPSPLGQLQARLAPFGPRAVVNAFGLGEREGAVTIFVDPEDPTATSTLPLAVEFDPGVQRTKQAERLTASITTGDAYLARHGIATVDLLKIDVEGAEPKVLAGFSEAMASGRVRLIQFEYGWMNAHTGATLKSFYQWLVPLGFRIGKLYPEGVAFKPYAYGDEDFLGPNYVACHESWPEAMAALRCPPLGP